MVSDDDGKLAKFLDVKGVQHNKHWFGCPRQGCPLVVASACTVPSSFPHYVAYANAAESLLRRVRPPESSTCAHPRRILSLTPRAPATARLPLFIPKHFEIDREASSIAREELRYVLAVSLSVFTSQSIAISVFWANWVLTRGASSLPCLRRRNREN